MFYYFKKTTVITILMLLLAHSQATDIAIDEKCICTQLLSKADCEALLCTWGPIAPSTADKCSPKSTVVDAKLPFSVLCSSQLNPSTDCKLINGCAFIDEKCQQFPGCTAYMGTTNEACQSFSTLCTTNGVICVDPKICNDYVTQLECSLNLSTSGSKRCVWDSTANSCRDQTCDEADISLNTDLKCNRFIEGCLTTGKGCTTARQACSTYSTECENLVGSDGYCETDSLGTSANCIPKKCSNALTNVRTDAECAKFQFGCITTGRGCSSSPLPLCSTYQGTKAECLIMLGSDGQCDGTTSDDTTTASCQVRTCALALTSNFTDALCAAYKSSCITNGQGCVDARIPCNNYSGTTSKCQLYVGSDGKCDGLVSDGPCKAKVCTDAPSTYNTDTLCSAFQNNCVTTGQGCVLIRQPCASYTGTETYCLTLIGSDGNCSGTGTTGNPCFAKSCALAPATYTTLDQCAKYQSGCVTNGKGCALKTTCLLTQYQVSCSGTPNCTWNSICVDSTQCAYYTTTSLCLNNKANSKECFWTGQICREKLCTDAPSTTLTIEACDAFLSGCVTNGAGCFSSLTPCASYTGTKTTCQLFIGNSKKCFSTSTTDGPCRDKTCADDTTSTTDGDCDLSLSGCKTKGSGCLPASEPCSSYSGSQSQCSLYTGTNGSTKCYIDTGTTGPCRELVCLDDLVSQSDGACKSFLNGCLTKGTGCISSTAPCSDYPSAGDKCSTFTGNGKACWFISGSNCIDKSCTHNTTSTTDSECKNFMNGCVTNGAGCVSDSSECTVYHGDETGCLKFVGNTKPCNRLNDCIDRACSDLSSALTQQECINYKSTCRFNGTGCFESQTSCSSYINLTAEVCQGLTTTSGSKCWLGSGSGQCVPKECSLKGTATNQGDCDSFLSNCMFTGSTCVPLQASCSSYTTFTQGACKLAKNLGGALCWKESNGVGTCADRACTDTVNTPNSENCLSHLGTCVFNGTTCSSKSAACTDYATNFTQLACKDLITNSNEKCWKEIGGTGTCEVRTCSNSVTAPNSVNCPAHKDSCRYDGTSCVDQQATCGAYASFTQAACRATTTTGGVSCWKVADTVGNCEDRACSQDIGVTPSVENCLAHLQTCRFNGTGCINQQASCGLYNTFTQSACQNVTRIDGLGCWKDSSTVGTCIERTCGNPVANPSVENCKNHNASCRFTGTICTNAQTSCASYIGFSQEQCQQVLLQDGVTKCWKTSSLNGICEDRQCDNVIINPSEVNCLAHLSNCAFNGSTCWLAQTDCSSYTTMLASQCQIIKTLSGGKCWLDQGIGSCIPRVCEHNTEATTDASCEEFLAGCKTKGKGCVLATLPCSSLQGTQSSCHYVKGVIYKCKGQNTAGQCSIRTCYDNMDADNNLDCDNFLKGCVTRGKGCLPSTAACSAYLGVRGTCINFLGNGKKCWNTLTATENSPCVDRKCSDDLTSQTDQACSDFQIGCVTKGAGCIASTAPCNSYVGTQTTCANFIGLGTKKCWNVLQATSLTPCIDRLCSHNTRASTDLECNTFLANCVNKGSGCAAPQPCAGFLGTSRTCAKFTATDGPCKGVGTTLANCIAQTCNEGLSTYVTDQLCNNFKSGCKTNGAGCIATAGCTDMQTQTSCIAKTGCIYVGNCRDLQTECGVYKTASICVNTPVLTTMKKCTWADNACRNWICSDASELITTDTGCLALHPSCTSKGKGCITKSSCASYTTSIICGAARTTDLGETCIWSSTICRSRTCEDASKGFKTDEQCSAYLAGCKTTGLGCTSPPFLCDAIVSQSRCTIDSENRPCIWQIENETCMNYSKCIDISLPTHNKCQQYSPYCTSDGVGCIALNICQNYLTPTACVLGNDGACGWIPATITSTAACVKFTSCDQASGIDNETCKVFNSNCISNGTNCVEYDTCSTYVSKVSCESGGSDGACFWDATALTCRLSVCSDANTTNSISITTNEGCAQFKATKTCTTNGTACVELNLCSSYLEQGCFIGTDGVCIYDYPVGQIQGTKVCRTKVCSDFKETTTAKCQSSMVGCISTGTACSQVLKCAEYTTKVACNSKGSDGVCVYTTVDSTTGTCALMSKCADANSDQVACNQKPSCNYQSVMKDGLENTSCVDHTCASISQGGTCLALPSFDGTKVSVCVPTSAGCTLGENTSLSSSTCFSMTNFAYTWNADTNLCDRCLEDTTTSPNSTNTTTPATTNSTDTTNSVLGLSGLITIMIGIL